MSGDKDVSLIKRWPLAAMICFYNDKAGLERLINSFVDARLDYIVAVDGRFNHYGKDDDPPLSKDGSREYLLSLKKNDIILKDKTKIVLLNKPGYEFQKRQAYLDYLYARNFRGFGLVIDTDEYVDTDRTDWSFFHMSIKDTCYDFQRNRGFNIFNVQVSAGPNYVDSMRLLYPDRQIGVSVSSQWMPRLWRNPGDMVYFLNHYSYRRRDPSHEYHQALYEPPIDNVEGLHIIHDHGLRGQNEQMNRITYQRWLMEFEQKVIPWYYRRFKSLPENLEECYLELVKHQESHYEKYEPEKYNPDRILIAKREVEKYASSK